MICRPGYVDHIVLSSSRKNPHPLQESPSEIPRGEGVLKVKILKAKYKAKLEFPGGGGEGAKQKTFYGGSMGIFWNCLFAMLVGSIY